MVTLCSAGGHCLGESGRRGRAPRAPSCRHHHRQLQAPPALRPYSTHCSRGLCLGHLGRYRLRCALRLPRAGEERRKGKGQNKRTAATISSSIGSHISGVQTFCALHLPLRAALPQALLMSVGARHNLCLGDTVSRVGGRRDSHATTCTRPAPGHGGATVAGVRHWRAAWRQAVIKPGLCATRRWRGRQQQLYEQDVGILSGDSRAGGMPRILGQTTHRC